LAYTGGVGIVTVHFRDSEHGKPAGFEAGNPGQEPSLYRSFGKRVFDILFVIVVAPVGLMLVAIAAFLTVLGGQLPFYLQPRVGKGGRLFRMLKIQTMVSNADAVLDAHLAQNPAARAEWAKKQKLENDPRVTRLGEILRKTSLDEMPQLWNVLKGDMSIVGPRPMMVDQRSLYPGNAYYALRPGITGPWQISDRSEGSFAGRAIFDAEYNQDLNLKTDLSILARTAGVVLRCTGR